MQHINTPLVHLKGLTNLRDLDLSDTLVMMLLASVGFGWQGTAIPRARERRDAVLAIVKLGGRVNYFERSSFLQRNDWLRKSLGNELLLDVEDVYFGSTKITDADLAHLKGLTQVKQLYLSNAQLSDANARELKESLPKCNINWSPSNNTPLTDD